MDSEFQSYLDVALAAANRAGEILRDHFRRGVSSEEKLAGSDTQGLVTAADLEAESTIIETIKESFPDHAFLAEESLASGDNASHLWVIDPLDGTNNFANGIPHFATSIGYWQNGEPTVGVVLDPMREEMFVAVRGSGVTLNGEAVEVNQHVEMREAMIATGFYYDRGDMMTQTLRCIETLFRKEVRGIRRMGAASLDLAWVACGRYSAFFELKLAPWDYAAARLMVTEGGGVFTDCLGASMELEPGSVLASNGKLHSEIVQLLGLSK